MTFDAGAFVDYYAARGWTLDGGASIRDWRALCGLWQRREKPRGGPAGGPGLKDLDEDERRLREAEAAHPSTFDTVAALRLLGDNV